MTLKISTENTEMESAKTSGVPEMDLEFYPSQLDYKAVSIDEKLENHLLSSQGTVSLGESTPMESEEMAEMINGLKDLNRKKEPSASDQPHSSKVDESTIGFVAPYGPNGLPYKKCL